MLLGVEGAFRVSIDYYDAAWSGHLELEISVVWHRIESSKCDSSEQCVVATTKGDDIEDNSSLGKLSRDPKTTSSVIEPMQRAFMPSMTPLNVVFVGLIRDGSMPVLRIVS